jgi:hypothetical protein
MNIERNLHLFTKVEDMPPKTDGVYMVVIKSYIGIARELKYNKKYEIWLCGTEIIDDVTHWLNLSRLTTKEEAIELAEKAYYKGFSDGGEVHTGDANLSTDNEWDEFINKNKYIL